MKLAQRAFSYSDQLRFAAVSGDRNPMHIDALQARRTQAGAPIVHGMNLLLWALDSFAAAHTGLPPLRSLAVHFYNFVHLDESVHLELIQQGTVRAQINILVGISQRSKITIEFGDPLPEPLGWDVNSLELIPTVSVPLQLEFEHMAGRCGRSSFAMTKQDAAVLFPSATSWIGAGRICALAATSYLIGMVCPGLYSIYRDLSIRTCSEWSRHEFIGFRVTRTDARFQLIEQEICGVGLIGLVRSFVRSPPVRQASMESLASAIGPADFAGAPVLVVGGSRGLGELTAKLIATGGGRVTITWQTGREDAERVAQEIRTAGGACETLAYDSRKPADAQLASLPEAPTHAYYFASPAIFRPASQSFSAERLKEFLAVYVEGFWHLSQGLRGRRHNVTLFYPSSIAVTERPRGITEYAMAKAAGEVLCADMTVFQAPLHVVVKRLPRLLTDQTASNTADAAQPLTTMVPIIREVQAWRS